ncbi:hypothetical protein F183_A38540 [Bryobacterales bacterium F-183]|nr:hypothetical protein F183_A38540 [Bryobacterales bacterium F-183]
MLEIAPGAQNGLMEQIERVCAYVREHLDETIPLATMAKLAGMSTFHFQRTFKKVTGVTPRQYVEARRLELLRGELRNPRRSVTDAIYEAGFGSSSRVYEKVDTRLGMTPAAYRAGGAGVRISWASTDSPLGRMMMGATDRGLCFVQFAETDDALLAMLRAEYPAAEIAPMAEPRDPQFDVWMEGLARHVRGEQPSETLPVDVRATAFQRKVWEYLQQKVVAGEVQSYAEVAEGIGEPRAARAVARACASNRVAMVIPCHRVIRGTGELGGYKWGVERKRTLLDAERAASSRR